MNRREENKRLRERYQMLSEWYGREFSATEMAARSHTPQPRPLADLLGAALKDLSDPEAQKLIALDQVWEEVIGKEFARFVHPGHFKGSELYVEVRHSALVLELQGIAGTLKKRINQRLGENFCTLLRIVASGSRSR